MYCGWAAQYEEVVEIHLVESGELGGQLLVRGEGEAGDEVTDRQVQQQVLVVVLQNWDNIILYC